MHGLSNVCSWCVFICSYIPPLCAVSLILANVLPYYLVFLPKLHATCVQDRVSWLYFFYCHVMMLVAEILVFVNFFLSIFQSPGYVERGPALRNHAISESTSRIRELTNDGWPRFCLHCEIYKPDYAHHCRRCRRCIYRMDHHCPWINNCVGRDNTKFFLQFLLYIPLGAFHISATTAYSYMFHFSFHGYSDTVVETHLVVIIIFSLAMGVVFFFFAVGFFVMVMYGETTISNAFAKRTLDERKRKEETQKFFDDVFGHDRRWWKMICPVPVRRPSAGASLEALL